MSVRSWIYSCDFKTIYTKWLCFTLSRYISLLLRKCIKIFIFWKKNLWFNQRVNFKDATPEFERKSMKIWAINNYGRKEHANTPFNTPATLMHEQELPLITWGMIQLGYLMANVKVRDDILQYKGEINNSYLFIIIFPSSWQPHCLSQSVPETRTNIGESGV